jgi:hypothetical protein
MRVWTDTGLTLMKVFMIPRCETIRGRRWPAIVKSTLVTENLAIAVGRQMGKGPRGAS